MKKFPTLMVVAVSVIALCWQGFCHAGDAPVAPHVQRSVQKSPVQNIPDLKVEMPTPRQTQKTPAQKGVIQKGTCKGPCCQQKSRFKFRSRTVIRERGRFMSRERVSIRAPGVRVSVGGGCCR